MLFLSPPFFYPCFIALGLLFTTMALAGLIYHALTTRWLDLWIGEQGEEQEQAAHHRLVPESNPAGGNDRALPSVTFFRPLKSGVADLRGKIETLIGALLPGDQLLLGADAGSPEEAVCRDCQAAFPDRDIVVVPCMPGAAVNPKISKLIQMESAARHGHWILSDCEALADGRFFLAFRREWQGCDVLTAGYRFAGLTSWPHRLDAAATLLTLWPGLATIWKAGRLNFTLGACTGFHRDDLLAVGGWRAFGHFLAEDQRMGAALAALGKTIRFSRQIFPLDSDPLSWRDYWRHQRRVAATYRVANPAGFAGAFFVHSITGAVALVGLFPLQLWTWVAFVAVWVARWRLARQMSRRLAFPIPGLFLIVLVAGLVESACWCLSWPTRYVWWGGKRWPLSKDGRITEPFPK